MADSSVGCMDIINGLQTLKDAILVHFDNIREADSVFGKDHADLLKRYIKTLEASDSSLGSLAPDAEDVLRLAVLPKAISRFAPRAIIRPSANLGSLGVLPREIRDAIYEYALFCGCVDTEICSCTRQEHTASSGLGLLGASGQIYNETIPILYKGNTFAIKLGYEMEFETEFETTNWVDPMVYRRTSMGLKLITSLPYDFLYLVHHLDLDLYNMSMFEDSPEEYPFKVCHDHFLHHINCLCTHLKDSDQLQSLEINLGFGCKSGDIEYMKSLLEPIKMLRDIREPGITVYGWQHKNDNAPVDEARWYLTDEYEDYLTELLASPHGTPTPPDDSLEVFHDSFGFGDMDLLDEAEVVEAARTRSEGLGSEQEMMNYLRDVYGTDDREALHGGLPARWHVFLNSHHEEGCDWAN